MRAILGFALVLGLGAAAATAADIDEKKLIGKWEPKEQPKKGGKVVTEFLKDGKVTFTTTGPKGKDLKFDGTYKVAGDKLTISLNFGGKETSSVLTVKSLTDDELVTENDKGKTETMKKVK